MRQFTVPQFIDAEDKILGALTVRQFLEMLVCFLLCFIYYKVFDFSLFITATLITFAISGMFAFGLINGRPFHYFVLNLIQTMKRPGLRIWGQVETERSSSVEFDEKKELDYVPIAAKPLNTSRLNQLSLIVDTSGVYKGVQKDKYEQKTK